MDEHPEIKAVLVVNNYYNYYNKHSLESITQKLSENAKLRRLLTLWMTLILLTMI